MAFFEFIFFPIWIVVFLSFIGVFLFIFWLWAIIDCLSSKLNTAEKLFWIVIIIFLNMIGALLYFIFSKVRMTEMVKAKNFKGKKLFRSKSNKVIAGVCSGIGEYLGIDPTIVRLLWVLFTFVSFGAGILAYIIAWIIIPEK